MTANSRKNRKNVVGEHVEIVVAHRSVGARGALELPDFSS